MNNLEDSINYQWRKHGSRKTIRGERLSTTDLLVQTSPVLKY